MKSLMKPSVRHQNPPRQVGGHVCDGATSQLAPDSASGVLIHRRRGTGYVLVISIAMMLSVIGFASVINARVTTRMAVGGNNWAGAGVLASSAVECAIARISDNPTWRDDLTSGVAEAYISTAQGSMTIVAVDADGDLSDNLNDSVRVYGVGRVGDATRVCAVTLQGAGRQGLDVLKTALHGDGNMLVKKGSLPLITATGGPLSCNAHLTNDNNTIGGDVEAVSFSNGGTVSGTITVPAPVKQMPSADVFDTYAAEATAIAYGGSNWKLEDSLLSPTSNPFGAPNPAGTYVLVVPPGDQMTVQNIRVWGTLLIRLATGSSIVIKEVVMENYQANYPVLLIQCVSAGSEVDFEIGAVLSEAGSGVNFNPDGSPFHGEFDNDMVDEYSSKLSGLVHVIRPPNDDSALTMIDAQGELAGPWIFDGRVQIDDLILNANPDIYNDPPPGYEVPTQMVVVPGTWQWESLPIAGVTGL